MSNIGKIYAYMKKTKTKSIRCVIQYRPKEDLGINVKDKDKIDVLYNTGRRKGNYLCKGGAKNLLDLLPVPPTVSVPRSHSRSSEQLEM